MSNDAARMDDNGNQLDDYNDLLLHPNDSATANHHSPSSSLSLSLSLAAGTSKKTTGKRKKGLLGIFHDNDNQQQMQRRHALEFFAPEIDSQQTGTSSQTTLQTEEKKNGLLSSSSSSSLSSSSLMISSQQQQLSLPNLQVKKEDKTVNNTNNYSISHAHDEECDHMEDSATQYDNDDAVEDNLESKVLSKVETILSPDETARVPLSSASDNINAESTARTSNLATMTAATVAATSIASSTTTTSSCNDSYINRYHHQNLQQQQFQPPGWRVKLYRLNMDGTWDDCGTGRIQFYYARKPSNRPHYHSRSYHSSNYQPPLEYRQRQLETEEDGNSSCELSSTAIRSAPDKKGESDEGDLSFQSKQNYQYYYHHSSSHCNNNNSSSNSSQMEQLFSPMALFQELGEPMLCMRAEIPDLSPSRRGEEDDTKNTSSDDNHSTNNNDRSKVLLRTRVLLHDAYQCQGGNIITWCEPFHDTEEPLSSSLLQDEEETQPLQEDLQQRSKNLLGKNYSRHPEQQPRKADQVSSLSSVGVDLALSFQDNAGCKDIWQHILQIQEQARDLAHLWGRSGEQRSIDNNVNDSTSDNDHRSFSSMIEMQPAVLHGSLKSGDLTACATSPIGRGGKILSHSTPELNAQKQHHQPHHHHHHLHQPLSPNSPDHDALEDRQLSMVTLPSRPPLLCSSSIDNRSNIYLNLNKTFQQTHTTTPHSNNYPEEGEGESSPKQPHHCDKEEEKFQKDISDMTVASSAAVTAAICAASSNDGCDESSSNEKESGSSCFEPTPLFQIQGSISCDSNGGGATKEFLSTQHFSPSKQLPNPPKWSDLEFIVSVIAGVGQQIDLRDELLLFLAQSDFAYIKSLLFLFHTSEDNERNYEGLTALAVCIKSILLLNDPEIIEYVTSDEQAFESICAVLEYNPELRERARYRLFLREQARFRSVVRMEDEQLIACIHRLFRVNYLKDFILRPTMDDGSLSTLVSLAQFTQADIVKGVTFDSCEGQRTGESYFTKILRMLGTEIREIQKIQLEEEDFSSTSLEKSKVAASQKLLVDELSTSPCEPCDVLPSVHSPFIGSALCTSSNDAINIPSISTWQQHVAPHDLSLQSRLIRRKGCLKFLKELFNMARSSLKQHEKDDFITTSVSVSVQLPIDFASMKLSVLSGNSVNHTLSVSSKEMDCGRSETNHINLLHLMGAILSDPSTDTEERGSALEVLSVITMHDPGVIRRYCLDTTASSKESAEDSLPLRPDPNELRQILFVCAPADLLQSLLYILATETDAGLILQTSEIIRILLDTEMLGEQESLGVISFFDENGDYGSSGYGINGRNSWHACNDNSIGLEGGSNQNAFLSMFYDRYVSWLVAPFQFKVFALKVALYSTGSTKEISRIRKDFKGDLADNKALKLVTSCAMRFSFLLEILCFCVRAHVYRMKLFVLRTRLLSTILKCLSQKSISEGSGERCLKLASLKLLRSVLSVKDEFYHRHIVQYNLFAPVFDIFRLNPVGSNLISSAILEMCDFIQKENIKCLVEYIVTKHLSNPLASDGIQNLEDIANPYVDTFKQLRHQFERNIISVSGSNIDEGGFFKHTGSAEQYDSTGSNGNGILLYNKKALEDQRKFRASDEEESYFNDDSMDLEELDPKKSTALSASNVIPLIEDNASLQD